MKVCVQMDVYVDVEEPIFEDLHRIHQSGANALGTDAQYEEAMSAIEKKVGVLFFDAERDGQEYGSPRIVCVADAKTFEPILEG